MKESDHSEISDSLVDQPIDVNQMITSLRTAGADQFDSLGLQYLEVLANRAITHQGSVKRILDGKLLHALTEFKVRFEQAQGLAKDTIDEIAPQYPHAVANLQRLLKGGDFKGMMRSVTILRDSENNSICPSLGDLVRDMAKHSSDPVMGGTEGIFHGGVGLRAELKATRYFRNTWSKLSVNKRVTQALDQAPRNAGPINSHMLVLRSLALMREISPEYLSRFTSYVDTLLCLDQCIKEKQANGKKVNDAANKKKVKTRQVKLAPTN
jgi:hypothetical protein